MSYVVSPFEVANKALPEPVQVRFVHLFSGIATRHSDTIDCEFLVNGRRVLVGVSCATLTDLRLRQQQPLRDQQVADIAALYLRRTLETGYDPTVTEFFVGGEQLHALAHELGYL